MRIFTYETTPNLISVHLISDLTRVVSAANRNEEFTLQDLDKKLVAELEAWDGDPFGTSNIFEMLGEDTQARILVATHKGTRFYDIGVKACPDADWGTSFESFISLDYSPDHARRANQLHECLHFFGVDDCYHDAPGCPPKPTCDNDDCVMRYGNVTINVCDEVLRQLR